MTTTSDDEPHAIARSGNRDDSRHGDLMEVPGEGYRLPMHPAKPVFEERRRHVLDVISQLPGPVPWQVLKDAGCDYPALRDLVAEAVVLYPAVGVFALARRYEQLPFSLSVLSAHGAEYFLCLTSAATYHGLIPQSDEYLWMVLPANRNTLREVCGFQPVPVRWNPMRLPTTPVELSDEDYSSVGGDPSMSAAELTERYFGVYRESIYGNPVKITSPARTICDLLMFKERPIGRVGLKGKAIESELVYDALREYTQNFELTEARVMAERLGYGDDVVDYFKVAERLTKTM